MKDKIIESAIEYITGLFQNEAGGHDVDHTLRVYHNALLICAEEPACDTESVILASLLHDTDDYKLFSTENNANARAFLKSHQISEKQTERICKIINSVSFSKNKDKRPETIEAMIVQDADRLDAMGAVGIARTFSYGGEHGRPMEESVQHFFDKLLLLKERMNTKTGRRMAEKRHDFLEIFLKEYREETDTENLTKTENRV